MADAKQLALIRRSVKGWNAWREKNPRTQVDISEADLQKADLSNAHLSEADLRDAVLHRVNLTGADLRRANLTDADLRRANLRDADLTDADLTDADLTDADLTDADLTDADLLDAILRHAKLTDADLTDANLRRANLSDADLTGADLTDAILDYANLADANLTDADLGMARLDSADLRRGDLRGAFLGDTNLSTADLTGANLSTVSLGETVFGDTNLKNAVGLDSCIHRGPSVIDYRTIAQSWPLPEVFLRGCGLPDNLITYLPSLLSDGAIQFYSCFISYSHADKSFARRLHDTLQGRGIRCWLDEKQLLPGHVIADEVDRGIRLWDKVLLCCSKNSLTSWWVSKEIGKAFEKEQMLMKKREGEEKILALIPLDLDHFLFEWKDGNASIIRERFAPDFTGWQKDHEKFEMQVENVIHALRADGGAQEKPPTPRL